MFCCRLLPSSVICCLYPPPSSLQESFSKLILLLWTWKLLVSSVPPFCFAIPFVHWGEAAGARHKEQIWSRSRLCNPVNAEGLSCASQALMPEKRAICGFWHILNSGLNSFLHEVFILPRAINNCQIKHGHANVTVLTL